MLSPTAIVLSYEHWRQILSLFAHSGVHGPLYSASSNTRTQLVSHFWALVVLFCPNSEYLPPFFLLVLKMSFSRILHPFFLSFAFNFFLPLATFQLPSSFLYNLPFFPGHAHFARTFLSTCTHNFPQRLALAPTFSLASVFFKVKVLKGI